MTSRFSTGLSLLTLLAVSFVGCGYDAYEFWGNHGSLTEPTVEGQLGDVVATEADESYVETSQAGGDYLYVDVRANAPSGALMVGLSVFDAPEPGAVYEYPGELDVIGCSGPAQDDWYYDQPADRATLVLDDEGIGHLHAEWDDLEGTRAIDLTLDMAR